MNKLKTIGISALAGSLVAVSAQAGELAVTGGLEATYSTESGDARTNSHGKGFGTEKGFTFTGTGELDNGWTFKGYHAINDSIGTTSSALSMTMGSMGTMKMGTGSGHGGKYDGQTPTAWEEVDDGGTTSLSANLVGTKIDGGNNIMYTSPALDLGGISATLDVEYTPNAGDTAVHNGAVVATQSVGSAIGVGLTLAGGGLTVGIYGNDGSDDSQTGAPDPFEGIWYANYSVGPISFGFSQSYFDDGSTGAHGAATASKTVKTASGLFETTQMSVAFAVNDDFSISYADAEDEYDGQSNNLSGTETADVTMDMSSIQAAYTMGAMSVKAYRTKTSNVGYSTIGGTNTTTEVALGLSF